ncbi:conjugative transfer region protein TrbK [Rhodopseudomonas pseudopalustris]|uniref:Conjugative transfer region protein TrbK n=2 Tax=Rhodopseudomonas pseudopalustris TaxID=1513892 RepID=A0A1H8PGV4_9BRAD|nr:conjugative transfer region protein TrbK [Rhodopseudomonas pseudopalustris]
MILAAAAVAVAIVHGGLSDEVGVMAPLERDQADALASELERCRTITSTEATALEACRRIWADNRRQFFAPARTRPSPAELPKTPSAPLKIQDRFLPTQIDPQQSETR